MCGRFLQLLHLEDLREIFDEHVRVELLLPPRYNVAPTTPVITAVIEDDVYVVTAMHWGLQPNWARSVLINAQAEKYLAEKKSFWTGFRRCLIPVSGFYEWRTGDRSSKQPMLIRRVDRRPFVFAGLWRNAATPEGTVEPHCVIVTTTPNTLMAAIHHRMPAILTPENARRWMNDSVERIDLGDVLEPFAEDTLEAIRVGRAVNNVQNDDPSIIEPIA